MKSSDEIKAAVITKLIEFRSKGKDILAGAFTDGMGHTSLDVTSAGADKFHITYCTGGRMWTWVVDRSELEPLKSL